MRRRNQFLQLVGQPPTCATCEVCRTGPLEAVADELRSRLDDIKIGRVHRRGDLLFRQGERGVGVYAVRNGLVGMRHIIADGRSVLVDLRGRGSLVGVPAFFLREAHPVSAEVLSEEADVCFLEERRFRDLVDHAPELLRALAEHMAGMLAAAPDRFAAPLLSVRARLAQVLSSMRFEHAVVGADGALHYRLPMSRQDLAALVLATPESISRAIRALKRDNVAHFTGRWVVVPDLDRLFDEIDRSAG